MRIPNLPVLLLFLSGFLIVGAASARAQAQSSSSRPTSQPATLQSASPVPAENFDLLQQPSTVMVVDQYRLSLKFSYTLGRAAKNIQPTQDEVCYTMRSYKVERAEKFSDADGVTSYSTCQPSSRFELKQAIDSLTDSK